MPNLLNQPSLPSSHTNTINSKTKTCQLSPSTDQNHSRPPYPICRTHRSLITLQPPSQTPSPLPVTIPHELAQLHPIPTDSSQPQNRGLHHNQFKPNQSSSSLINVTSPHPSSSAINPKPFQICHQSHNQPASSNQIHKPNLSPILQTIPKQSTPN
jgi:hypothetical protein